MNEIREVVQNAFEMYYGVHFLDYRLVPLKDLFIDSFNFINFVVEIESSLAIEIPDQYLIINELPNIETFIQIIENLRYEQCVRN